MIFSKEVQTENVVSGNPVTLSETIIDFKFEQTEKAYPSIYVTDFGITISFKEEQ